jgi:hypothetical protein
MGTLHYIFIYQDPQKATAISWDYPFKSNDQATMFFLQITFFALKVYTELYLFRSLA